MTSDPHRDHPKAGNAPEAAGVSPFANTAESIGVRNLKIIILTMPLVFLAAIALIIVLFGRDDDEATQASSRAGAETAAPRAPDVLDFDADIVAGNVAAIDLDGDRLAVRIDDSNGVVVRIYDVTTGALIQSIDIEPAVE